MLDPATSPSGGPAFPPGDLAVRLSRTHPGTALLVLRGEIDALTAPQLQAGLQRLMAEPVDRFVIDMTGVAFLASSGLAELIRVAQRAAEQDLRLRLVATGRAVRRPLQITGSDQLFDLFDDVDAAIVDPV